LDQARRGGCDPSGATDIAKARPTEDGHLNFFKSQAFDGALSGGVRENQARDRSESGRLNLIMPSTPNT
tara:strand:- start:495 stop:701 length:207 start_codon:yes stop_codon:yes gene_type:complete